MSDFEDTLDAIRIDMYERTKDMKTEDIVRQINARARKTAAKFGLRIVSGPQPEASWEKTVWRGRSSRAAGRRPKLSPRRPKTVELMTVLLPPLLS